MTYATANTHAQPSTVLFRYALPQDLIAALPSDLAHLDAITFPVDALQAQAEIVLRAAPPDVYQSQTCRRMTDERQLECATTPYALGDAAQAVAEQAQAMRAARWAGLPPARLENAFYGAHDATAHSANRKQPSAPWESLHLAMLALEPTLPADLHKPMLLHVSTTSVSGLHSAALRAASIPPSHEAALSAQGYTAAECVVVTGAKLVAAMAKAYLVMLAPRKGSRRPVPVASGRDDHADLLPHLIAEHAQDALEMAQDALRVLRQGVDHTMGTAPLEWAKSQKSAL